MKIFRIVKDFLIVLFVAYFFITKIFHTPDYWWVAIITAIFMTIPDVVELYKDKQKSPDK